MENIAVILNINIYYIIIIKIISFLFSIVANNNFTL